MDDESLLEGPRGYSDESIQALQALRKQRGGSRQPTHLPPVPTVMGAALKLPVLVECVPYSARLMERACVDRWEKAQTIVKNGKGLKRGTAAKTNALRRSALSFCGKCKVGAKRARKVNCD